MSEPKFSVGQRVIAPNPGWSAVYRVVSVEERDGTRGYVVESESVALSRKREHLQEWFPEHELEFWGGAA